MKKNDAEYLGDLIGVDVGGTFTDLVRLNQTTGRVQLAKVASTLENQAFGVIQALKDAETNLCDVALVVRYNNNNECCLRAKTEPHRSNHDSRF